MADEVLHFNMKLYYIVAKQKAKKKDGNAHH